MGEASPKVKVKQEKTQTLWSQNQRWEFYELSLFKKNSIQLCFEKIKSKHIVRFANYNLCNVFIHPSFTLILFTLFSFTLEKGDSPFIHPFSTQTSWRFTLQEGWFTLKGEYVHPFWRVNLLSRSSFTLREGWFTLQKGWMEGWIGWITLRRVNEGSHNTL